MRIPVRVIGSREPEFEERYDRWGRPIRTLRPEGFGGDRDYMRGGERMSRKSKLVEAEEREEALEEEEAVEAQVVEPGPVAGNGGSRDEVGSDSELDWKDKYVRLLADFDNHRRHAQAERERLSAVGKEAVLGDVFPVIEHLERAIRAARESRDASGMLEGIEMVYREFISVLEKHGVERIPTVGETFDPSRHEAVAMVPGREEPEGTILEEVRPGFTRGGKLLRPASVVVAG